MYLNIIKLLKSNPFLMHLSIYYLFRDKNLILEPICCLFKLILYQYKEKY